MAKKIVITEHERRSTSIELSVKAELRSVRDVEDIDPFIWTFNSMKETYNVSNGMLLGHIYELEKQGPLKAVLWHKDIKGDRDRRVLTIEVVDHE